MTWCVTGWLCDGFSGQKPWRMECGAADRHCRQAPSTSTRVGQVHPSSYSSYLVSTAACHVWAQGLGKTLQVISLIWTLLKQGPEVSWCLTAPVHSCLPCAATDAAVSPPCTRTTSSRRGVNLDNLPCRHMQCRASPPCARPWWSRPAASLRQASAWLMPSECCCPSCCWHCRWRIVACWPYKLLHVSSPVATCSQIDINCHSAAKCRTGRTSSASGWASSGCAAWC